MEPGAVSWDPAWDKIYQRHVKRYPAEEAVGFVLRNFGSAPARHDVKILDLGCGQGAHLWFLAREGFEAYGIDGSATGVELARALLVKDGLSAHLVTGDLVDLDRYYPATRFGGLIDVGSVQHNPLGPAKRILDQARNLLKPGGKIFSMMTRAGTSGDGLGTPAGARAWKDIPEGPLSGFGFIQLCTRDDVETLFSGFTHLRIDTVDQTVDDGKYVSKRWLIEADAA